MLKYRCEVEWLLQVPPEAFSPPPKVESAVVRLRPWRTPRYNCDSETRLQQLLTTAFNMRRKTLRNALRGMDAVAAAEAAGIDLGRRPEEVDVATWVALCNLLGREHTSTP
jgi:16S rRNA (adenine1518-N6/adenine1519-N6)-dimethyltransferase